MSSLRAGRGLGWLALLLTSGAPAATPVLTIEPPPALTNARTLLIRGFTASGCEVVVVLGGQTATLRTGPDGSFEVGPLELAEGQNLLQVTATSGADSSRYSCTIAADRQPPPLRLDPPWDIGSPAPSAPQPRTVRGVTEPGCTVAVGLGGQQFGPVPSGADGSFEVQLLGNLPDGVQRFELIATDAAGNQTRIERELAIDATPPRLTIDRPLDQDFATADREVSLSGVVEPGARLRVRLNDQPMLLTSITDEGHFALLRLPLHPGANELVVEAVDGAGNKTLAVRQITLDHAAPDLYLASPLDQFVYRTAVPVVRVVGQAEPGARILLRTDAGDLREFDTDAQGRFDGGVLLLGEGTTGLVWTARDAAGNLTTLQRWVAVDRQPPQIQITSPGPLAYVETEQLRLAGRSEPGALLVLHRDGQEQRVVADASGAFAFDSLALQDGRNSLVLTATDSLGNARLLPIDIVARLQPLWLRVTEPEEGWQSATPSRLALVTEADALLSATLDGAVLEPWPLAPPRSIGPDAVVRYYPSQQTTSLADGALVEPPVQEPAPSQDELPWRAALADLRELAPGPHTVTVDATSPSGLRRAHVHRSFHVPGPPRSLLVWTAADEAPGRRVVQAQAFDAWDMPVADGTLVEIRAPRGWLIEDRTVAQLRSVNGGVSAILRPVGTARRGVVLASVGRLTESARLPGR